MGAVNLPRAVESLELRLCLASDEATGAYEVTIEFGEIDVAVSVLDPDLGQAIQMAAERCAECLKPKGYMVTSADVIRALASALDDSGAARVDPRSLN